MKKPTTLRTLIFVLALLFNFASYSQNEIAFNSKLSSGSNENFFLKANNSENRFSFDLDAAPSKTSAAPLTNPVIPYAQLPYAGQVTQCPNDGKLLPKLFLCGGNDSRLIDTKITDAQSIIWERFASGGGCVAVSNSDCANEAADASCWNQVGTGQDYLANVAGQFRVKIIDNTGTPYIFYFNVYQNTLIPTATTKSDIIRNSAGNCQISGKITVGGFGAGYQYSFTTTGTSGAWQDSNIFTTNTPGNYTAYIRIKGVVGSCEFKVINLDIKNVSFAVTTSITSPKCSGATGSVQVITNDIKQEYTYTIYNGTNTSGASLNKVGPTQDATTTFTGLLPGTYTILTSIKGSTCAPEKNTITIANAPNPITSGASITQALGVCNSGQITITRGGGTAPYKFFVNTNGAGFQENPTNIIVVTQPGSYVIRVEDANGCSSASNVTVNVPAVTKPIYQINKVDGDCLGNVGKISLNVSNNNTYNLIQYSIDNGVNFSSSTTVFNIPNPGSYRVVVRYRKNVSGNEAFCTEPASIITVGPSVALTASAGVGELSGCGPVGKELYGLVRIINPQGGTPFPGAFPYKYSFDGKQTWVDNNTEYMNYGGPYTVYIKDAVGCEYAMGGITIDKKPDPPTIKILDPVFNCDGSATTTVTVTNSGTGDPKYSYDYYMDGVLNTSVPTNVFKNVTQGDHTVTVKYNVLKVSTYSNLLQEDFGKGGFTTTPGINPAYCYEDEAFTHLLPGYSCNKDEWINDGEYAVASQIRTRFGNSWIVAKDHTTPADPLGRFLVVNVGGTAGIGGILYSKPIKDVIENQDVIISLWAENLIVKTSTTHDDPKLTIQLVNNLNGVGGTETIVATTDTSNPWVVPKSEKWEYKELLLNPGAYKNLSFVIRSYSNQFNGNDVLIDDIWVRQIPKSCNTVADFPIYVDGSKAFSAGITGFKNILCNGEQNGEITLSAKNFDPTKGFQYLVAGDPAGWQTYKPVPAANSGSITLTNLKAGTYSIQIRYDNSANSCVFPVAQEIKMPTALTLTAKVTKVATCELGATITAEAKNGTPGYQYELRKEDGVTVVAGYTFSNSAVFTDVPVGKYVVVAKDLNECQAAVPAKVEVLPAVKPTLAFGPIPQCFDSKTGLDLTLTIGGGVGPYTYTVAYNGGTPSLPSATFNGPTFTYKATNEGTYEFVVKDSYACETEAKSTIIKAQLLTSTNVTTGLDCDPAPNNQAVISGEIKGGTAPYVVSITSGVTTGTLVQPVANGNTFTYSVATAGNYTFQIKDANNCITTSEAIIAPLDAITLSTKNTNPKCNGGSTGIIELIAGGGAGDFTYSKDNITFNLNSIITGLKGGIKYTFYVKDKNKCVKSIDVTLTDPSPVVASASIPNNTTCSKTTVITVTGAGGTPGYSYSFNGSTAYDPLKNTLTVTNTKAAQKITYSVKDSNDCIDTKEIDIPAYDPPVGITFSTPAAITCAPGKTTTSVTLTPKSGGIAPYSYTITAGPNNVGTTSTSVFSGLIAGSYTFQIKDANGCTDFGSITIDAAKTISVSGKKTDVKCVGQTNGTATFTVNGASSVGNFTYVLTPTSGTVTQVNDVVTVTGLGAGTYTLQVTDKTTGCSSNVASVTIAPATAITITAATATNVNCKNSISNIVVTANGGLPNYKYAYVIKGSGMPAATAFSNINTTINTGATQSNLFWDVYVMDQNDCTAGPFDLEIKKDASPSVKTPAPATFCFKAPSSTTKDLSTFFNLGTGTHTYTVNGVSVANPTTYKITASGTYTIVVTDANTCTATATYIINDELTILATRAKDLDCNSNGQITFTANGGSGTYSTYEVQVNGAGAWTSVTSPYPASAAGDYQFRVTDNAGCQAVSNIIKITAKTTPTFTHNEKNPTCIGATNGEINITNPTGLAPFTYEIKKGAVVVSTTATKTNLSAGVYDILLTDSKGCTETAQITLSDPNPLTATVNSTPLACNTDNTTKEGTITVTAPSGGTGIGYEYSFNGGAFSPTPNFSTSITGTAIAVKMRDSNNCEQSLGSVTFNALDAPKITNITASLITCKAGENVSDVEITTSNGVGTKTYVIVSGPSSTNTTGATDGKFKGLADGFYVFKVTDANGCSTTGDITIKPLVTITASLVSQVNVKCNGNSTGSAQITVGSYSTTYTAALTAGTGSVAQTGNIVDVTGLANGSYTLRVTDDTTTCFKDVNFTITQAATLTLVEATNKNAFCSQPLSKVSVTAGGGKAPYSYAFRSTTGNPATGDYVLNKNTADLDPAITTWYAWVKDANGCETSTTITIAKDPDVQIAKPASQCFVGTAFNITLSEVAGTGVAPYSYTVNGTSVANDIVAGLPVHTATYSVKASGTYRLAIKDANGCSHFVDYIVEKQLTATAVPDKDITCIAPTAASITVTITNGTAPFSYQIYDGTTALGTGSAPTGSFTETFTTAGNYSFEIKDVNNCPVKTNAVTVTATVPVVMYPVTVTKNILCSGESTAEIKVTYDNTQGRGPFKINVKQYAELAHTTLLKDFDTQTSGLPAGFYVVTVTDSRGCFDTEFVTINPVDPINVSFKGNDITCVTGSGLSKGSIVVNFATGGSGTYTYQVKNDTGYTSPLVPSSGGSYTFDLINFGNYQLTVIDSNGCSWVEKDILIASPPENLDLVVTPTTPPCGALGSAEVKVATSLAGPLPFFFAIYKPGIVYSAGDPAWYPEDGTNSLKTTIPGLIPGVTYTFIVYDDNTKCYYFKTFKNTVPSASTLDAAAVAVPITCIGEADGSVNLTINSSYGTSTNVTYEIFNAATLVTTGIVDSGTVPANGSLNITKFGGKPTYTGLPYGTYYVLVTEASGCTSTTANFSITESTFELEIEAGSNKNDNCANDAGVITAIGKKGTSPYTYAIVANNAAQPTVFTGVNTFNVEAGDWDVYVKDFNGCIKKADVNVAADPEPEILAVTPAATCYTGTPVNVTITTKTPIFGPVTYSVDKGAVIGAYGSSASFDLTPGTYTLNIKDGNGCTDSQTYVLREQLTLSPKSVKELDCNTPAPNGGFTVEAQGGNNTYNYTITAGAGNTTGASTGIFTGLDAGTYTVEVNDGFCTATTTVKIDALIDIVPAKDVTPPLCPGNAAKVVITATGGTGVYTYQKGAAPTLPTETANIFSQTAAEGTVTYYVKDSKGCVKTIDVTVTDPTPVTITLVDVDQMLCGGGNTPTDAKITVTATGGAGNYEYSFDNGLNFSPDKFFITTTAKTYDIIVKDANGCLSAAAIGTVNPLDPPVFAPFGLTQMTCPGLTTDVTINYTHGIGLVTYKMVSGTTTSTSGDSSGTYTGLTPGDYVFRITDSNNCTAEKSLNIPNLPTLQMQEQVVANVDCMGNKTGSATFTASNFTASGAFTYSVVTTPLGLTYTDSKVNDVVTLTALAKGRYEVTFKDNTTLCTVTKFVDITEPTVALSLTATASNVNCNDSISQFTMTPVGGTLNYTYSIVESGTPAGTYSTTTTIDTATLTNGVTVGLGMTWLVDVYIKDANNCTAMTTVTITKDDTPTVTTPTLANNQCTANGNYTFTATATGVAPFKFSIDNVTYFDSATNTYEFTVPAPTTASQAYTVYVTDGNGCPATSTTTTTVYKPLKLNVTQDKEITCIAMPVTGAQFTLTASDGNPAYTYAVNINGGGFNTISSTMPYTANVTGTYIFRVTDSNNCPVDSDEILVSDPVNPDFTTTKVDVKCYTDATGTITVTPSGGVGPYTFALSGAGTNNSGDATGLYTGLQAGSYTVAITDSYGCTSAVKPAIDIIEPTELRASASAPDNKTCSTTTVITITGQDGTPGPVGQEYTYSFDNGLTYDSSNTLSVDDNGSVQTIWYSVKDANGCKTAPQSIDVQPLNKPDQLTFSASPITCKLGEDVSTVQVKARNGVGGLTFRIIATNTATPATAFGPITTADSSVAASFPDLLPGDYTFQVTDNFGCSYQDVYKVLDKVDIAVDGILNKGVLCKTEANGKVTFVVSGFAAGFTYNITGVNAPGLVTPVGTDKFELTNLAAGSYTINVTDSATNCVASSTVDVPEPDALQVKYTPIKNANCTDGFKVQAAAIDGTPGYTYAFVKAGDPIVYDVADTAVLDKGFTWTIWAKDSHGCEASIPVTIIVDPAPAITNVVATQCPSATNTYDITVTATGFTADLEYSLDGNTWQLNNNILTATRTGTHTVYVRDKNKCQVTSTVDILEPLKLLFDITIPPTCTTTNGQVTLTASGGSNNYEYSIDGTTYVASNVFNNLGPGNYTFHVKDLGTPCTKSVDVLIDIPNTAIDFTLTPSKTLCNGASDGTITVNMATPTTTVNNNPVYTYSISPAPVGMVLVGNVFKNLPQGLYTVTVTSGKGCPVSLDATVDQPAIIDVPNAVVAQYVCTAGNKDNYATITVPLPTGGSDDYKVYEFLRDGNAVPVQRGDSNVYTESDLLGHAYVINVYDTNGCLGSTTATINPFVAIDFGTPAVTVTQPITCANDENIQVNVVTTGTTTPMPVLIYHVKGTNAGNTYDQTKNNGTFLQLPIGIYSVTVTNPATGCILNYIHYVNNPNTFNLITENVKNVACFGTATGSIDLTIVDNEVDPKDDAGIFDYQISGPVMINGRSTGATITIPNLVAGVYTVKAQLVGSPYCEVESTFAIDQPLTALQISETHTVITCDPGNDGTITVSANGGWVGGYQFELVGPVSVPYSDQYFFENLVDGVYTLNVKDFNGCIETTTVTLRNPQPIVVTAQATVADVTCNGDASGEITVDLPTGGQGTNYQYILNYLSVDPVVSSTPQISPVFSGLSAGTYSVTVIDGINCSSQPTADIVINEPAKVKANLTLETGVTCKTDATVTLSAFDGNAPYTYSTDASFSTVLGTFASSVTFSVGFGDHQYYVRDSKGCISDISNNITVTPLAPLDLKIDLSNAVVYCKGSLTAVIDAEATGGLENYIYTLYDGSGNILKPAQSTGYFDQLPQGTYVVRVDSGDCQYDSAPIVITEPAAELSAIPTVTDATCFGANNGKIEIAATGGTGIIKYAISPNLAQFDDKAVFDRLAPGIYTILVQDENSCFVLIEREIKEPNPLEGKVVGPIIQEICDGDNDGAFTVEVSGGRPPYSISLDNENGTYIPLNNGTRHDFTALKGGTHNVYIKDASCTTMVEVMMDKAVVLNPTAEVTYDCVNNAQANMVVVTVDASNNPTDVDYSLDNNGTYQPSNIFTNVPAGTHFIVARHTNGCEVPTATFDVEGIAEVSLIDVTNSTTDINVITVKASGGIAPYEYSFNGEPFSSSNTYRIYKTGDYPVIVRDKNGCEATIIVHGIFYDFCMPNYFTPNGAGSNTTIGPDCGALAYKELTFDIFDRYGRAVAKYRVGQKWDGKYNGNELPTGDYWYVLKLNDPKDNREFVGHFTLYR
ncbi:T9SS type B sorting domain-containing protein [Flavobacterium olei]|uniref:T9SS type B sorting domain-containing protein n=1 Tax=Flavobacterium olei TaxID=1886782 RepID=UPI00321B0A63